MTLGDLHRDVKRGGDYNYDRGGGWWGVGGHLGGLRGRRWQGDDE